MNRKRLQYSKVLILSCSLLFVGCGADMQGNKKQSAFQCSTADCKSFFEVKPGDQEGIMNHREIVPSFSKCLGLSSPQVSAATKNTVSSLLDTMSKDGLISSVSAPMMMGLTSIAANFCTDLMNKEKGLSTRKFFMGFNLGGSANSQTYNIGTSVQALASSCWGRAAKQDEIDIIIAAMTAASLQTSKDTKAGLFLCTTVLASAETVRY